MTRENVATIGLARDEKHNYFWNGRGPIPSVTRILQVIDKPAIIGWAKREVAQAAVRELDTLARMVQTGGPQSAAKWLATIPGYQSDKAKDIGSDVHRIAETIARADEAFVDERVLAHVDNYRRFLDDFKPRFLALEFLVCSLKHDYAGTGDVLGYINGKLTLADIKTGKNVYAETALQLAAYGNADFIGYPGRADTDPIPPIEQYAVIHVTADGYQYIPVHVDGRTFEAFLGARALHAWLSTDAAEGVIGDPLKPVEEVAA